jgi:hypothetical protein
MAPIIEDVTLNYLPYILHPGAALGRIHESTSPICGDASDDNSSPGGSVVSWGSSSDQYPLPDTDNPVTAGTPPVPDKGVACPAEAHPGSSGGSGPSHRQGTQRGQLRQAGGKGVKVAAPEGLRGLIPAPPSQEDMWLAHDEDCNPKSRTKPAAAKAPHGGARSLVAYLQGSSSGTCLPCCSGADVYPGDVPTSLMGFLYCRFSPL